MNGELLGGQVAIVTGAAQGIGRRVAERLAGAGAAVVLADQNRELASKGAVELRERGLRAESTWVDIANPANVASMVDDVARRLGRVDALVNAAGLDAPPGLAWEVTVEDWRRVIDVDLSGSWWCAREVLPHMIKRGRGRIVFISSIAARRGSLHTSVAYNAAKAGLLGLTVGLAAQVEQFGVLVNAITPGPTGTGTPMSEQKAADDRARFPLPILGPTPVADACLYLLGPSGDWVSGTVLNVSGGRWHG